MSRRHCRRDLGADGFGRCPHGVGGQVGVAGCGDGLSMAQQFANHRKAHTSSSGDGSKGVSQVVYTQVRQASFGANAPPWLLKVNKVMA